MRRCFELARKGLGLTRSNPLVGSVIVHNDRIIGEGYHHEFGGPHAEVNAIRSVKDSSLLADSTIYVNLEPCSHFGKTPPCSLLITQKGIRRVVISNEDPFPEVNGAGIKDLRENGVEVVVGVLREEGYNLNRRFFVYNINKRPYIILKWAQTQDGFIDIHREPDDPIGPNWITNEIARTLVHKWRTEEAGILTGSNTILADNPWLNVRRWTGNDPVRITIDRSGKLFDGLHILDGSIDTVVFNSGQVAYAGKIRSLQVDHDADLVEIMDELYNLQIISIMVEGGKKLLDSFIENSLWDEARVFTGRAKFGDGIEAPGLGAEPLEQTEYHGNKLERFVNFQNI